MTQTPNGQPQEAKAWWEDDKYWSEYEDDGGTSFSPDIEKIVAEATRRGRLEMAEEIEKYLKSQDHESCIAWGEGQTCCVEKIITRLKNEEK